jgi:transcriptional regulator with XRE-family HTH domain
MDEKGLSSNALAKAVRVSQPYIHRLKKGEKSNLSADYLFRIADALGVPVEHFRPFILDVPADPPPPEPAKRKPRKT